MNAFWKAANPLIEDVAKNMYNKGRMEGDENIKNAALHLSNFFFGRTDIAEGKGSVITKEDPENEVSKEKREWEETKHNEFRRNVENDLRQQLVDVITGHDERTGKTKLDPDGILSPFIQQTIIDRVIQDIGNTLAADQAHMRYMDSLWSRAKSNGRTDTDKSRLISAFLARARSLAPSLRSKYVSEATGKRVRDVNQRREKAVSVQSRTPDVGRSSSNGRGSGRIDYRKTSDYDILSDNITYKH
jgi:hypothetical protein